MISWLDPLGELPPCHRQDLRVILNISSKESIMVYRTTGASVLASMMRADRVRRAALEQDLAWLLHGPTDPEVVEDEAAEQPALLMAAE